MTELPPQPDPESPGSDPPKNPGPFPTPADYRAAEELESATADPVKTIRTRAEKWLPALTAVTTVVTTALIIKGTEAFSKIEGEIDLPFVTWVVDAKKAAAWLIGFALVALLVATMSAYTAAFGSAISTELVDPDPVDLAYRWEAWQKRAVKKSRGRLRRSIVLAVSAAVALALAVGVATFAPSSSVGSSSVCLYVGDQLVAQIPAPAQIEKLPEGSEIGDC